MKGINKVKSWNFYFRKKKFKVEGESGRLWLNIVSLISIDGFFLIIKRILDEEFFKWFNIIFSLKER